MACTRAVRLRDVWRWPVQEQVADGRCCRTGVARKQGKGCHCGAGSGFPRVGVTSEGVDVLISYRNDLSVQ